VGTCRSRAPEAFLAWPIGEMENNEQNLNAGTEGSSNSVQEEEFALIRAVQAGDRDAFGPLVNRYQRKIYLLAYGMTGNHADADDLAQEVFLKAYGALGRFKFKSQFYTWLYRIAVNTIITRRKQWRRHRHVELNPEWDEHGGSPYLPNSLKASTPGGELGRRERQKGLQEQLDAALAGLSEKHRAVVVMYDIEGMSHAEIAKVLGCSKGTARSRLHYAHRYLRQKLKGVKEG